MLGGLTVLTHLNPWLVALHFLLSMSLIAVTLPAVDAAARRMPTAAACPAGGRAASPASRSRSTAATLVIGTVVTGSGPHAGDTQHGKVHRTGLQVRRWRNCTPTR